jgi:hypothetical protein
LGHFKHPCLSDCHSVVKTPDATAYGSPLNLFIHHRPLNKKAFLMFQEGFVG